MEAGVKVHFVNRFCSWVLWCTSLCLKGIYNLQTSILWKFGNGLMCCESLTRFFLLTSMYILLLLKITVRKKVVSPSLLSLSIAPGVLRSVLHFSNVTVISIQLVLSRQVLFCSVLFSWCVRICLASYLVGCITSNLVILVCMFLGKGYCRDTSKLVFCFSFPLFTSLCPLKWVPA